jgi:1,4-alpha-glucan branching enzyme
VTSLRGCAAQHVEGHLADNPIEALPLDRLAALARGEESDPFAVLGIHGEIVTAFDPGAEAMILIAAGSETEMHTVPGAPGVFAARTSAKEYRFKGSAAGAVWETEDPYRFPPVLGALDEHLLSEGKHLRLWQALGAHVRNHEGVPGTHFAVWAPNARRVSVVGDFNSWDGRRHVMRRLGATGVWEIFLPGVGEGAAYKYQIIGPDGDCLPLKADPVGFGAQHPPETASVVRDISGYGWHDSAWMESRAAHNTRNAPVSIYEVHLGSWRRRYDQDGRPLSYKEAAEDLVNYASFMGFTHLELLPVSEHPFSGSWGYQPVGMYAPTIRFGPPHEFRDLVDAAHRAGLGVIIDWVPGHFPSDEHGLARFDGTHLYEHADPKEGYHQDWNTLIYNFGRTEVQNYIASNALYWLEEYHLDGLRVDAVASMLYRDYSRGEGEWIPNRYGGRENLEAIELLKRMNATVYDKVPGIMTIAEESTSYPKVSHPVDSGGLGFGFKWNMGWMNDTLAYMARDPVHRKHHHHQMTFGLAYAWSENFVLPLSHDEVVHGKGSLLGKMPGNRAEKFANLRAYYGFMWGHPGKKLLFMGGELAQEREWDHDGELDWGVVDDPSHAGVQRLVRDLNALYRTEPALYVHDCEARGFQWLEPDAADLSVYAWIRRGGPNDREAVFISNFTPVERHYRIGLPRGGTWREALNTDAALYGGGNHGNMGSIEARDEPHHGQGFSAMITLPSLSTLIFLSE